MLLVVGRKTLFWARPQDYLGEKDKHGVYNLIEEMDAKKIISKIIREFQTGMNTV